MAQARRSLLKLSSAGPGSVAPSTVARELQGLDEASQEAEIEELAKQFKGAAPLQQSVITCMTTIKKAYDEVSPAVGRKVEHSTSQLCRQHSPVDLQKKHMIIMRKAFDKVRACTRRLASLYMPQLWQQQGGSQQQLTCIYGGHCLLWVHLRRCVIIRAVMGPFALRLKLHKSSAHPAATTELAVSTCVDTHTFTQIPLRCAVFLTVM